MKQISLTDDRLTPATSTEPDEPEPSVDTNETVNRTHGPVTNHSAVDSVDVTSMELSTDANGWSDFPHPETITANVEKDMNADEATLSEDVKQAIDNLLDEQDLGGFLVMDAAEVYSYLETLQRKSDLHLENFHRRQLVVNQLSGGRGYAKGASLSTYDKKWICEWEVRRRMAEKDMESWPGKTPLSKKNTGLPGTNDTKAPNA